MLFLRLFIALALMIPVTSVFATNTWAENMMVKSNVDKGKRLFNQCKACHSLTATSRQRLGPDLSGLFSRKVGTNPNFKYSTALKEADFVWTEEYLIEWLTKPNAFLPGNKMPYAGMRKEQDRKDLIAYLRLATVSKD